MPRMKLAVVLFWALLSILALTAAAGTPAIAHAQAANPSLAWYQDHWIDLSKSWETATACNVQPDGTTCYRTEAQMNAAIGPTATSHFSPAVTCGSALHLYDGTSFTGTSISFSSRLTVINLSTYGFDNLTSSYKIGACAADFYSGSNLTGTLYPGNTSANASATSMLSGWDNSIYYMLDDEGGGA